LLLALFLFCTAPIYLLAQVQVKNLVCENMANPIGLDIAKPRFGWQLECANRNCLQTSYQLRVAKSVAALNAGKDLEWETGKLASNQSVFVDYAGKPLQSGATYYWQVKVWDNNTKISAWSKPASFTTGFFKTSDWKAKWIEVGYAEDSSRPSPMFRKKFN